MLAVVLAVAGVLYLAHQYLHSPEFEQRLSRSARDVLGSEVRIGDVQISLFQGVVIRNLGVANPPGVDGELFSVEEVELRIRLLPLLSRRVEVDRFRLRNLNVRLVPVEDGRWNFEALSGLETDGKAAGGAVRAEQAGFDFAFSDFSVEGAGITMLNGRGEEVTRVENLDLSGVVEMAGEEWSGAGSVRMESLSLGEAATISDLEAPVSISRQEILLNPVTATLAGGRVSGEIALRLVPEFKYLIDLEIADADVSGLLEEARTAVGLTGRLRSSLDVEGRAGLPTVTGSGEVQVEGGKLSGFAVQSVLARFLNVPELNEIEFTECRMEFTVADNVLETTSIRLLSPLLEFTGQGVVTLPEALLDHNVTLALRGDLLEILPPALLRAFETREDGFRAIPFRVWGPMGAPQTDLSDRIVEGAVSPALEEGLERLRELFR